MPLSRWQAPPPVALRGIILRSESRERVIVQATPEEIAAFSARDGDPVNVHPREMRVVVGPPMAMSTSSSPGPIPPELPTVDPYEVMRHGLLYDRYGRPVARVTDVQVHVDHIDVTDWGGVVNRFVTGHRRISIQAEAIS